jgi:hypothetical protein
MYNLQVHSLRKFFKTQLITAEAPAAEVDPEDSVGTGFGFEGISEFRIP